MTKAQSHSAVAVAVRDGYLPRPDTLSCADCGGKAIEYDHRDYSKPLEVDAVCRRCHSQRGPAKGCERAKRIVRAEYLMVRVTGDEKTRIEEKAAKAGYSTVSGYARDVLLNVDITRRIEASAA